MKYFSFLMILSITILLMYAFQAERKPISPNIKTISNLTFEGKMGQERLSNDPDRPTMIIWFHPDCENCQYQLDIINANIDRLGMARFFFITADTNFFKNKYISMWPNLMHSSYVIFGIINKSKFIAEFGPVVTPSILFFNRKGILKEKLYGEVKIEKILHLITYISDPKETMGGSN